jgi:hypothetical protein
VALIGWLYFIRFREGFSMLNCWNTVRRFFSRENGRAVVHCAVMLELIAIVCLAAMGSIQR